MRIQFKIEGGIAHFPGLSRPVLIDSDDLSEEEASELRRLVESARFFDLPRSAGAPARGAADYRQYTVTVEESGRQHTVQVVDPVEDPALQQLVGYLQQKTRALRRAERPPRPDQGPAQP